MMASESPLDTNALFQIAWDSGQKGDWDHARRCYERGAILGDPQCIQALGYMYDVGEGVPADKAMAMKLYRRAWRLGDHAAASNLAVLYREQGKTRTMFQWFRRLADAGDGSAQLDMAKCYLDGRGVRRNLQAAAKCLANAAASPFISEAEREEAQSLLDTLRPRAV